MKSSIAKLCFMILCWLLAVYFTYKDTYYDYFVSYSRSWKEWFWVSSSSINSKKIDTLEKIKEIEQLIKDERKFDNVVITNYILLRKSK